MSVLTRLTKLGGGIESVQGTYVVPTFSVPWMQAKYIDTTDPLRDESVRANDDKLQGLTAGPKQAAWDLTTSLYPDIIGYFIKLMGLFDTCVAGVATTLSSGSSAAATSVSTAASIASGTTVKIGSGAAVEYATTGAPSGSGPYTIPVTGLGSGGGLLYAHSSSDPVTAQSVHTFRQNRTFSTVWPSISFTTNDGVDILGWAGMVASELGIKIDPKGLVQISTKFAGQPSATQADFSYGASQAQPLPGWGWTVYNGGGSSTRGITMDFTFKRAQEIIHSSTGNQAPREVFPDALEVDGTYKAIFESDADVSLFRAYTQTPTTHTISQPLGLGGASLAITLSQSGYTTSEVDNSPAYLQLTQALSGISNASDTGVSTVTLKNYVASAF